ncbi:unnamed protein product [Paramecium pentaurelia]|uniref:Uncharacterized protein n=1 Tax=Paramecium pentaurelia TaxID=43138 RepID=A0A8S1S115_9CILI|nr:unnamed protein product [Paramecium pentaurelia]
MIKLLKQFLLIGNTQKINLITSCPIINNYILKASIVLSEVLNVKTKRKQRNNKLEILSSYFTKLWNVCLGLVENKILFYQKIQIKYYIKNYHDKIEKYINIRINKSIQIFHVFNTTTELQLIRQEGIQKLFQ